MVKRREGGNPESSPDNESASGQHWESTLILDMPRLGHVESRLQLRKSSLHLVLTAAQDALLRAHWEELAQSLQHLGLQVATSQILRPDESIQG